MTKGKKSAAAKPAAGQRTRPPHGGSFIRDPETGELECVAQTKSATRPSRGEIASEPESSADQTGVSGDLAGSALGSTGDGAGSTPDTSGEGNSSQEG